MPPGSELHVLQWTCLIVEKLLLSVMSAWWGDPGLRALFGQFRHSQQAITQAHRRAILHSAKENGQLSVSLTHSKAGEMSNEDRWEHLSDSNSLRKDSNHWLQGILLANRRLYLSWYTNTEPLRTLLVYKQDQMMISGEKVQPLNRAHSHAPSISKM